MSEQIDVERYTSDELNKDLLRNLIEKRKSFTVIGINDMSFVVKKIENEIEKYGLTCRVYSEFRSTAMAGVVVPTGFTQITGLATAIGIGLHNLATLNPDYELGKNKLGNSLNVMYKKD
jgi:hypothetical protein